MSKDYIFEPRPVYSSHTPNLFLGSYYIEDDFQADPSMWADPLEDAFVTNSGMKEGKIESVTNLNEFSAETVLMGTNKLDTSEVIPQSYFWKWDNYESHLQIPTQISEDDFESSAYEQFLEVALGYHSDEDPYFLLVVKSFMDEGDDPDIWAEEADWTRIQTTKRWWEIYDQWMDVGGVDFLLDKADDDYDWAMSNAGDLQMIGWEMPLPDDDDFYFRQAENESHWMTFGQVDYNWATDPYDVELTDEEFSNIDEHIRNEVRYEIDTNNLPGESNISSSDISLSLTEDDEDDFTIYYYWGSAKTTGVNSAEGFEAETLGKDSCCCGATKSKPCACMATGAKCSGSCACDSAAKKAESFEAEYIHIYDTTITEPEILKKLEGAGIKPTDYYWLTEDIFGLHINSSDADAFQEEFNKKDWTGLYAFDAHGGVRFKRAESFASEGPYSDYECGQCREYGDYNPGEAPAAEEECDSCGDSLCINCYTYDGGLCMSCDGFMSEDEPERVWTILIDDNDAYSETFVFNSKKSAINFREAAMDSEYLQQQDIGVYNIVEQQVINEEYPSDSDIADWLSVDCLKCGDDCGCDN